MGVVCQWGVLDPYELIGHFIRNLYAVIQSCAMHKNHNTDTGQVLRSNVRMSCQMSNVRIEESWQSCWSPTGAETQGFSCTIVSRCENLNQKWFEVKWQTYV